MVEKLLFCCYAVFFFFSLSFLLLFLDTRCEVPDSLSVLAKNMSDVESHRLNVMNSLRSYVYGGQKVHDFYAIMDPGAFVPPSFRITTIILKYKTEV